MSYLRKKLQAIMACADFKGYLREVTGAPPLTLTDCMGSDLVSLSVTGNAVQDGTPSPETPVEVQGVGERTGNLLDAESIVDTTEDTDMEIIEYSGRRCLTWIDSANTSKHLCMEGQFKENTQYTFALTGYSEKGMTISIIYTDGTSSSFGILGGSWNTVYKQTLAGKTVSYWKGNHNYGQHVYLDLANSQILEGSYTAETAPDYEPYGYKVSGRVEELNLLDYTKATDRFGTPLTIIDNGVSWDSHVSYYFFIPCNLKACMTVRLSCKSDYPENSDIINSFNVHYVDGSADYQDIKYPITLKNDVDRIQIRKRNASTESETPIKVTDIMLVQGSYTADTMPAYEPYHEPQEFAVYLPQQIAKVGDVADTVVVDFEKRTAELRKNVGSVETDCASVVSLNDNGITLMCRNSRLSSGLYQSAEHKEMLNKYFPYIPNSSVDTEGVGPNMVGAVYQTYVRINKSRIDITEEDTLETLADKCQAFLNTLNEPKTYYVLATPTTTDISALQDWDAMPSTWRGTVVISADTTVQPSSMTAQYYATKKED